MQKYLAVAALCAASLVIPALPAHAAPALSEAEVNCLIFPMLKKECWEMGAERATAVPAAVASATVDAAETASDVRVPLLWNCTIAPAGSGHLLDC